MVKQKYWIICLWMITYILPVYSLETKEQSVEMLRHYYAKHPMEFVHVQCHPELLAAYLKQFNVGGFFRDLRMEKEQKYYKKPTSVQQEVMGERLKKAFIRLWTISENCRSENKPLPAGFWKAVIYYGKIETGRPNNGRRFHASCFYMPGYANGIYFSNLKLMDRVERGEERSTDLVEANRLLRAISLQSWTHPWRDDATQIDYISVERFRNHVWWVGGNALGYRDLLATAAVQHSVKMIEVLSEVCQKSFSAVSQPTINKAFWTEGFTADGAGWGHGRQNLVWGYPIHGAVGALDFLHKLQGTAFEKCLDKENTKAIMNCLRGSSFFYYKGYIPPCVSRLSYLYYEKKKIFIPYRELVNRCVAYFLNQFTIEDQKELLTLQQELEHKQILDMGAFSPFYTGIHWFWNNDDLVKKDAESYVLVNMASSRCDGLESAHTVNDAANVFACDGQTMFMKDGNEYAEIMGAIDRTSLSGITARVGDSLVIPETNWDGYCSRYNLAAGVTDNARYGACGFVFEKMNARQKNGKSWTPIPFYDGVKAYKSYFLLGDYLLALGAGITDLHRNFEQEIHTTLDQTLYKGDLCLLSDTCSLLLKERRGILFSKNESPLWLVHQGGFAYALLGGGDSLHYVVDRRINRWTERHAGNKAIKNLPTHSTVFQLWLNHGAHPTDTSYAYMVYTGSGTPELKHYPFIIVENSVRRQIVSDNTKTVCAGMVYDATDSFQLWGKICKVSVPCAFLLKKTPDGYELVINDAEMDANRGSIYFDFGGQSYHIKCYQEALCGKPIKISLISK